MAPKPVDKPAKRTKLLVYGSEAGREAVPNEVYGSPKMVKKPCQMGPKLNQILV
jgi:hypothetical protein